MRTSSAPGFAARAQSLLPGLVRHSCENDDGRDFISELADTETAHALEHIAVELMACAGSRRDLKARTTWDFVADGRGVFHVRLAFDDDLVALGALRDAVVIATWLLGPVGDAPDVDAMAARLREVRAR